MVKSIISMICVALILLVGAIWECNYVQKEFNELHDSLQIVYEKVDDEVATMDDIYAVQKLWLNKKKTMHMFLPHNEIKEVDLWIAESVTLVRDKEWQDALSKLEVLRELSEQIPKSFKVSLSNIF